jgi:hypothetical protein
MSDYGSQFPIDDEALKRSLELERAHKPLFGGRGSDFWAYNQSLNSVARKGG